MYCDDIEDEVSYPTQIDPQDLTTTSESYSTRHSLPPSNKRVARGQRDRSPGFGPPLHQDSGFDEHMMNELRMNDESSSEEPTDSEVDSEDSDDEAPQPPQMCARPRPSHGALAAESLAYAR